jgi:hypothetical protein
VYKTELQFCKVKLEARFYETEKFWDRPSDWIKHRCSNKIKTIQFHFHFQFRKFVRDDFTLVSREEFPVGVHHPERKLYSQPFGKLEVPMSANAHPTSAESRLPPSALASCATKPEPSSLINGVDCFLAWTKPLRAMNAYVFVVDYV